MPTKTKALVVVAHPDDEVLFFAGFIMSKNYDWQVVCVTDGNADGKGDYRQGQFALACKALGVKRFECWQYPDKFDQRLDIFPLEKRLASLNDRKLVFTHGILGEYGHRHHQDVSYATHLALAKKCKVYSAAYNIYPEIKINLTEKQYKKKTQILGDIYHDETKKLIHLLPATYCEGFVKLDIGEARTIYEHIVFEKELETKLIKKYKWLEAVILHNKATLDTRIF